MEGLKRETKQVSICSERNLRKTSKPFLILDDKIPVIPTYTMYCIGLVFYRKRVKGCVAGNDYCLI